MLARMFGRGRRGPGPPDRLHPAGDAARTTSRRRSRRCRARTAAAGETRLVNQRLRTREWSGRRLLRRARHHRGRVPGAIDEAYRRQAKALHPDRNPDADGRGPVQAPDRGLRGAAGPGDPRRPTTTSGSGWTRGSLYASDPRRRPQPRPGLRADPDAGRRHLPPIRKERRPLPTGVRVGLGWALVIVAGSRRPVGAPGPLPSPHRRRHGPRRPDHPRDHGGEADRVRRRRHQVPAARARWHRPPVVATGPQPATVTPILGQAPKGRIAALSGAGSAPGDRRPCGLPAQLDITRIMGVTL